MRAQFKIPLVTLALICSLPWMKDLTVSNKESIENDSAVDSIEDLEHSTITDLLSEMEKGSMLREFLVEKHAEKSWQVSSFYLYFHIYFFSYFLTGC